MQAVNAKYKNEGKKVPNLRFPGFERAWANKKFGELGYFLGGGTPSTKNQEFWNGYIPWISSSDLSEDNIYGINYNRYISQEAVKQSATKIVPAKSILIVSRVGVGKVAVNELELCTSQDYSNLVLANDYYLFVAYLIKIKTKRLLEFNQGTSIKGFLKSDLESLKIQIPSLPEQQKIAYFLSAVDQKIQQLTRKKELLELYKKGVMQKIFSREIRFKPDNASFDSAQEAEQVGGGKEVEQNRVVERSRNYPDWEEKRLGDILTFVSTNSLSRNDLNYDSGEIKNIHYGDIHTTFKMGFDVEKEKVPFINEEVDLRKITKDQFCQVGDIVVADASEDYSDIGKAIEVLNVGNERIVSGLHTFLARDTAGQTIKGFKGYLFQTWQIRKQIMKVAQGISVLGISKKNLAKVEFLLPCREEQGKITTLLKNIDKRIANTLTQITQTQKFKNGLLQQMFV